MPENEVIDAIDRKILAALQHDGRMSNLKLAEAVSLSPTAVLARTQRLIRDGFIMGFEARLSPAKLVRHDGVRRGVTGPHNAKHLPDAFKAAVLTHPEISECHMVAGGFDYLIKLRVRDMEAYREICQSPPVAIPWRTRNANLCGD